MAKGRIRKVAFLLAFLLTAVTILGAAAAEEPVTGGEPSQDGGGETPGETGQDPEPGDNPGDDPGDDPGDNPDPGDDPDPGDNPDGPSETENPDSDKDFPEGMSEGWPGGMRRSFARRRGSSEKQPGEPLIADHSRGTGDMTLYGTVKLKEDGKQIRELILDNESVGLGCQNGTFTMTLEGEAMILTADEETEWFMSQFSLLTLKRSGISRLILRTPERETALDTDISISGRIYGQERAAGFVTGDFILCSLQGRWTVCVEDRTYLLEQGELKLPEETQEEML